MRKFVAVAAFLFLLSVSSPAFAQNELYFNTVSVDILPEYDQPATLVIYHLSLPANTTLPASINLRIPSQAEVYAVAVSDPSKGLLNAPYDRVVDGSLATLTITADTLEVQVEYYDSLEKNEASRHIVFEWQGDYAVNEFSVTLQQPTGATDLQMDPALAKGNVAQDGFVYYRSIPQPLQKGQSYNLTVDYQKSTDALSTTGLPVEPAQPLDTNTPGRVSNSSVLPWVLAGLGGALIVIAIVGGIYFWRSGSRRHHTSRKRHAQPQQENEPGIIYCHQCGKRAQPGDVFCRTCGTRLQKEQ